ncbi:hypothetical protein HDV63DRAFT_47639 [Trichoderma sp. SZMC 28014]
MEIDPGIDSSTTECLDCEKNPQLKHLRELALAGGEHHATNFWQHVFNKHAFTEKIYNIATEFPPQGYDDQSRMDMAVQIWEPVMRKVHHSSPTQYRFTLFIAGEGKRGNATPKDIETVEEQVFDKCERYIAQEEGPSSVWAFTYFGPFFRLWAYHPAFTELVAFLPGAQERSGRESYLDLRGNETKFTAAVVYMKEERRPITENLDTLNF